MKPSEQSKAMFDMPASDSLGTRRIMIVTVTLLIVGAGLVSCFDKVLRAAAPPIEGGSRDRIWHHIDEGSIARPGTREVMPSAYRTLSLDMVELNRTLANVPMEFTDEAKKTPVEITIPLPDGGFGRFYIVESPMLEQNTAALFPEIKNYSGQGVDEPSATMRFNLNINGFHAIILSTTGTFLIEPYAKGDTEHYISYDRRNGPAETRQRCSVTDFGGNVPRLHSRPMNLINQGALRTYFFAAAATGEYTNQARQPGDTDAMAQQRAMGAINTTIMGVNAIYIRDVSIRLTVITSTAIIFTDPNTDGYTSGTINSLISENQTKLDTVILDANYDIGHVFDGTVTCSNGAPGCANGLARTPSACITGQKGMGTSGGTSVELAAHEIGHQFGATHTFNANQFGSCGSFNGSPQRAAATAYEPASGSSIMSYGSTCTDATGTADLQRSRDLFFNASSLEQIVIYTSSGAGNSCGVETQTGNNGLTMSFSQEVTVPARTPFELSVLAQNIEPGQGAVETVSWEEFDLGDPSPPDADDGQRPIFRVYPPTLVQQRNFPRLDYILNNSNNPPATYNCGTPANPVDCLTGEILPTVSRTGDDAMMFQAVARDNNSIGGAINIVTVRVNVIGGAGPFEITTPPATSPTTWVQGTGQIVSWNNANTQHPPIDCDNVKISLSLDGGDTFPIVLAQNTPNDGTEAVFIPEDVALVNNARVKVESIIVGNSHKFFDISDRDITIDRVVVTSTADSGDRTLRKAIIDANSNPNLTRIPFEIQEGFGVETINLTAELPLITSPVIIDGWSQGGPGYSGPPLIQLNGASADPGFFTNGLTISAGNSTVQGLIINRFSGSGIDIRTNGGNKIIGCYIGVNANGTSAQGNGGAGILISNTPNNEIGRRLPSAENIISGNNIGVHISGAGATGNEVRNNYIGTNPAGADLGNLLDGIRITDAPGNLIGGTRNDSGFLLPTGNIISGNGTNNFGADGIEITGIGATLNTVQANLIGLNPAGTTSLNNLGNGINVENAANNIIGGGISAERNFIVGNAGGGFSIFIGAASSSTLIQGNYIGTNVSGTAALPNNNATNVPAESANNQIRGNLISGQTGGGGIHLFGATGTSIESNFIGTNADGTAALSASGTGITLTNGASNNTIGGAQAGFGNLISGNFTAISDFGISSVIQGNFIGTNPTGTAAVPNARGIVVDGGANHEIGGIVAMARNVISGNGDGGHAIRLANTNGSIVRGNLIGTNAAGTAALGNGLIAGGHGIQVFNSTNTIIGGATAEARNIISASGGNGIHISGGGATVVQGNYIGTDANGTANLGNGQTTGSPGIQIEAGSHTIGGTGPGQGNIIAFSGCFCFGNNFGSGIRVLSSSTTGNRIRGNSIFGNAELGIDLSGGTETLRVTANDNCDADAGPNNLQNFPVLTSAGSSNGTTIISGSFNSIAGTSFTLDFYASPVCDSAGNGEGKTYVGSSMVTTDGSCNTSFAMSFVGSVPAGQALTCTATDAAGNTSEFSVCATVSSTLNIPAGTYPSLTVPAGATVTLSGDVTITGQLILNGDLDTSGFTLTMPNTATTTGNGDVIGNVKRTGFVIGQAVSFGNPLNTIQFDSGTPPTEVTVNLVKSAPASFPNAVARTYTITPVGGSAYSATLQLHYIDSELNGNDEASVQLWRNDGSAWAGQGATTRDANDNWVRLTAVTAFSPWAISGPGGPTSVDLVSFDATAYDEGVFLKWQTGLEVDNLGFNIHRDEGGKLARINTQLLAGSALKIGHGVTLGSGYSYSWWDSRIADCGAGIADCGGARYWLEDVDTSGRSVWHGPFYPGKPQANQRPAHVQQAKTLAELSGSEISSAPVETRARLLRSVSASSPEAQNQQVIAASRNAVKLQVNREAWYTIAAHELLASGLDPSVDPRMLQLFVDGRQQPIAVAGQDDGTFNPTDVVGFYGTGIDSPFSDQRTYYLVAGKEPGLRIRGLQSPAHPSPAGSYPLTVERRDRTIYFSALRNGDKENFFGAVVSGQPVVQTLTLTHLAGSAKPASLKVALQGVTTVSHIVSVQLNGSELGEIGFEGQATGGTTISVSSSLLREGSNQVTLTASGGPADVSLVDFIQLTYQHSFTADGDGLRFLANAGEHITVDGFTKDAIQVFDVTDSFAVQEVTGFIDKQSRADGQTQFSVSLVVPGKGQRSLLALTRENSASIARVSSDYPSNLRGTGQGADLVIVTRREMIDSLQGLKHVRQKDGLSVAIVDIGDIYDEFSFGQKSPQAVKDFLGFARTEWKRPIKYVLLVGDASVDAKNYLGLGDSDLVPTRLIDTAFMETASDDWLADFDGDGIADLAIGRLPARDASEARLMTDKILTYEQSRASEEALLVSDRNDGFDFEASSERLREFIPTGSRVSHLKRGELGDQAARAALIDGVNRGPRIVNYLGHGSVNLWRGGLLSSSDASQLENREHLSMFVVMNCLNGYFVDPAIESLSEALLTSSAGAVAVWASSGMTFAAAQGPMNREFYRQVFNARARLGEAAIKAKAATLDVDARRTWLLLGDPTMKVK